MTDPDPQLPPGLRYRYRPSMREGILTDLDLPDPAEFYAPIVEAEITTLIPSRYWRAQTDIAEVIEWFDDPRGTLLLYGAVGTGKSHAAYAGMRRYIASGRRGEDAPPVYGGSITWLIEQFRPGGNEEVLGRIMNTDIALLDDLGATKLTEWAFDRLFEVIDHRFANGLPMVVCTNLLPGVLPETIDERIVSRIGADATYVAFNGRDRRLT